MNLAWLSLGALVVAMIISCFSQLNVGVLGLALAWILGVYLGGMKLAEGDERISHTDFSDAVGVTLLFTQAQLNRTLEHIAHASVRICRGNTGLVPVMFFVLARSSRRSGRATSPPRRCLRRWRWRVGARASIPPFLMAIMVGNGAHPGRSRPSRRLASSSRR